MSEALWIHADVHPQIGVRRDTEVARRHADDRHRLVGEPKRAADQRRIAAVLLAPEPVRNDSHRPTLPSFVLIVRKAAAHRHRQPEKIEEPFGHLVHGRPHRRAVAPNQRAVDPHRGHGPENGIVQAVSSTGATQPLVRLPSVKRVRTEYRSATRARRRPEQRHLTVLIAVVADLSAGVTGRPA